MLTVRRDVLSQVSLGGPRAETLAGSSDVTAAVEPPSARSGVDQPGVGVRSARRRRRRRRFREMMAVLVVLLVLFVATVVILGLQWLESPSGSGGSQPAPSSSTQSLTLRTGLVAPTVER